MNRMLVRAAVVGVLMVSAATSTLAEQPAKPSRSVIARPLGVYDSTGALVGPFTDEVVYIPFGNTEMVRAYPFKQTLGNFFVTYFTVPNCDGGRYVLPMYGGQALSSDRRIIFNPDLSSSIYTGSIPSPVEDITVRSEHLVSIGVDGTATITCYNVEGFPVTVSPFVGRPLPFVPPYTLR